MANPDQKRRPPKRWIWVNALAAVCVAAVLAAVAVWQLGDDDAAGGGPFVPTADVVSALTGQLDALAAAQTEHDFVAAAGEDPDASSWARTAWSNLELLGTQNLDFRYVSGAQAPIDASGTRKARVHITWALGSDSGLAADASSATVVLLLRPLSSTEVAITGAAVDDGRLPLWLAGELQRQRGNGTIVYTVNHGSEALDGVRLGGRAAAQVRRVMTEPDFAPLVLIVPDDASTLASLLDESDAGELAAITSRLDGRGDGPVAIFCNPDVFASMDDRAAQVVMTHEATHAMTGAIGHSGPPWVIEGFADWVALHDDDAGLSTSAGQILAKVAEDGPPEQLPESQDFVASRDDLGTVYESAWMVFRMLTDRHSDADIIAFYRSVLDDTAVESAAQEHLGMTVRQITSRWQRYLENNASMVSE